MYIYKKKINIFFLEKKKVYIYKYKKKTNIFFLEKKKTSNNIINLHFLVLNFKFEYYEKHFFEYNKYFFSIKDIFIEKNTKQLFNSNYFKYVKESNFFQIKFFFKEKFLTYDFFYHFKILLFYNFILFFDLFIYLNFKFNLNIIFNKKLLKLYKNLIKKNIKNIIKLIKKLKLKKLKKKKLIKEANEQIITIKNDKKIIINSYDEDFFELYIYLKIELKNIKNINLIKITKDKDKIFKYYKNIDKLINNVQKEKLLNTYKKNKWNDLNYIEKLDLINIELNFFLYIHKKKNYTSSSYLKLCKEIDMVDLIENDKKNVIYYNNYFENNKIQTFIEMAKKHLDSEIFAKKEIDYILYICFNFIKSTMVFKTEKKKKIFLEPSIDNIIKNELKENIITTKRVFIERSFNIMIWKYIYFKNFKYLNVDNYISIENNLFYFSNNDDFNFKNNLLDPFNLNYFKKKNMIFFKIDDVFFIKKKNLNFNNYVFTVNFKYNLININFINNY